MSGLILALVATAAASAAPAVSTTSYGSCDTSHDDAHRRLASAAPANDDAPIKCNVKEADCPAPDHWYPPGYVSNSTGCCHCEASCDHDAETAQDAHRLLSEDDERYRRFLASDAPSTDHGACGYYDAAGSSGGHALTVTYGNCHHACHDCELNACARFWLEQDSAGKQGWRRTGRNEQFYYDGLVILALLCITILFEILHHHARHYTGHLHGSTSTWMAHVTGHSEAAPRETQAPEHPADFVSCLTWNASTTTTFRDSYWSSSSGKLSCWASWR